jgi:hypothetical protein
MCITRKSLAKKKKLSSHTSLYGGLVRCYRYFFAGKKRINKVENCALFCFLEFIESKNIEKKKEQRTRSLLIHICCQLNKHIIFIFYLF